MTDPAPWASPSGSPAEQPAAPFNAPGEQPPGAPLAPPTGPPAPPTSPPPPPPPPGGGAPGQPFGAVPGAPGPGANGAGANGQGWTPPPKPGLIPLRPLTLGPLLGASFQVMRRNPKPTFGLSLLLSGSVSVLALVITGLVLALMLQRVANAAPGEQDTIAAGAFGVAALASLIPIAAAIGAFAILQGVISLEVARGTVGEKLTLRGLLRRARGRIWALVAWALLLTAAAGLAVTLVVLLGFGLFVLFGGVGALLGALLSFLLGAGLFVLAVWIGVKTSLVPSVLMMERLPLRAAIVRSWRLTGGYFWRTFGIQLLVLVIINTAVSIVATPIQFVGVILLTLVNPTQHADAFITGTVVLYLTTMVVSLIASAIGLIVQSSAAALIYIDLRMRKEGLDVDLVRFVEARQAGDDSVPDPYLTTGGVPAPQQAPWQ